MKKARVLAPATFPAGTRLALSQDQARARRHLLAPQGQNTYLATGEVCFKAGEVIGIDGELPKVLAAIVETEGTEPRAPATAATTRKSRAAASAAAAAAE